MCVRACTWEPGEQTVELSLGHGGPGQVKRGGLAFDDACQGLVSERAAPTHVHVTPQPLVTAPAQDSDMIHSQAVSAFLCVHQLETRSAQRHTHTHAHSIDEHVVCRTGVCDVPLVPGLTDGHAGQQLGSVQVSKHGHPDLLLPSSLVPHVLKGWQRQQRRRRQGRGRRRSSSLLLL